MSNRNRPRRHPGFNRGSKSQRLRRTKEREIKLNSLLEQIVAVWQQKHSSENNAFQDLSVSKTKELLYSIELKAEDINDLFDFLMYNKPVEKTMNDLKKHLENHLKNLNDSIQQRGNSEFFKIETAEYDCNSGSDSFAGSTIHSLNNSITNDLSYVSVQMNDESNLNVDSQMCLSKIKVEVDMDEETTFLNESCYTPHRDISSFKVRTEPQVSFLCGNDVLSVNSLHRTDQENTCPLNKNCEISNSVIPSNICCTNSNCTELNAEKKDNCNDNLLFIKLEFQDDNCSESVTFFQQEMNSKSVLRKTKALLKEQPEKTYTITALNGSPKLEDHVVNDSHTNKEISNVNLMKENKLKKKRPVNYLKKKGTCCKKNCRNVQKSGVPVSKESINIEDENYKTRHLFDPEFGKIKIGNFLMRIFSIQDKFLRLMQFTSVMDKVSSAKCKINKRVRRFKDPYSRAKSQRYRRAIQRESKLMTLLEQIAAICQHKYSQEGSKFLDIPVTKTKKILGPVVMNADDIKNLFDFLMYDEPVEETVNDLINCVEYKLKNTNDSVQRSQNSGSFEIPVTKYEDNNAIDSVSESTIHSLHNSATNDLNCVRIQMNDESSLKVDSQVFLSNVKHEFNVKEKNAAFSHESCNKSHGAMSSIKMRTDPDSQVSFLSESEILSVSSLRMTDQEKVSPLHKNCEISTSVILSNVCCSTTRCVGFHAQRNKKCKKKGASRQLKHPYQNCRSASQRLRRAKEREIKMKTLLKQIVAVCKYKHSQESSALQEMSAKKTKELPGSIELNASDLNHLSDFLTYDKPVEEIMNDLIKCIEYQLKNGNDNVQQIRNSESIPNQTAKYVNSGGDSIALSTIHSLYNSATNNISYINKQLNDESALKVNPQVFLSNVKHEVNEREENATFLSESCYTSHLETSSVRMRTDSEIYFLNGNEVLSINPLHVTDEENICPLNKNCEVSNSVIPSNMCCITSSCTELHAERNDNNDDNLLFVKLEFQEDNDNEYEKIFQQEMNLESMHHKTKTHVKEEPKKTYTVAALNGSPKWKGHIVDYCRTNREISDEKFDVNKLTTHNFSHPSKNPIITSDDYEESQMSVKTTRNNLKNNRICSKKNCRNIRKTGVSNSKAAINMDGEIYKTSYIFDPEFGKITISNTRNTS
ncbi:uncharacterized protein NPIL_102851 [Nephila pilipes]|uniref:Uncharacterized protein n=1 Tax=Nephila pilipes TaxID=299642 RepID=A0A8X6UKC7_NEPPI|nr:uncharacterized protein NPIL_102851 [Nephila pilipes]